MLIAEPTMIVSNSTYIHAHIHSLEIKQNKDLGASFKFRFSSSEIKRIYRGFKTECPTGKREVGGL